MGKPEQDPEKGENHSWKTEAGGQSHLEAWLLSELCGREGSVYMQSCWLKTLRMGWRVDYGRFPIWIY